MGVSERQLTANRENAKSSTGPKSKNGQAVACQNATQHGLFSSRLLLEGEDPAEFQELLADLQATLRAVGAVELGLVERIAVTMWRQRRLVCAETAALHLSRQLKKIASGVSSELGLCFSAELKEDDLTPFDTEQAEWCEKVLEEIEALEELDFEIEFKTLPKAVPLLFAQLKSDAEADGENIERTKGTTCADVVCHVDVFIPTVSEWGLVVLTLLLLVGGKLAFRTRHATPPLW